MFKILSNLIRLSTRGLGSSYKLFIFFPSLFSFFQDHPNHGVRLRFILSTFCFVSACVPEAFCIINFTLFCTTKKSGPHPSIPTLVHKSSKTRRKGSNWRFLFSSLCAFSSLNGRVYYGSDPLKKMKSAGRQLSPFGPADSIFSWTASRGAVHLLRFL